MDDKDELKRAIAEAATNGALVAFFAELDFKSLKDAGRVLAELHNEGAHDAVDFFDSVDWQALSSRDRTRVAMVLESCGGELKDEPKRLLSFFHRVAAALKQQNKYHIDNAFESWAARNDASLPEISALIAKSYEGSRFLSTLVHAWRKTDPARALSATLAFSSDARPGVQRDAIFALGVFTYVDMDEAAPAIARLSALLQSAPGEARLMAIAASARLLGAQDTPIGELVNRLEELSVAPAPDTRHALIAGHVYNRSAYPEKLRRPVFELMKTVTAERPDTLDRIDSALSFMDLDADRETVFEIITAILTSETSAPSLQFFDSLTHRLENADHSVLCWYVTRWLLDSEHVICSQLGDLFPPLGRDAYSFELSAFDLKPEEVFFLARKVYAYLFFAHGGAVSMLSACLMALKLSHRKSLEADINGFWLKNFPADIEIFDAVVEKAPQKGLKASVARMRARLNAYNAPLNDLPMNPALRPSTMERRVQTEFARERARQVNRIAQEKSILSAVATTSTLLYGRTSVTYIYPGDGEEPIRQIIPMTKFETSTPIPRMDVLYPSRLNYFLYQFRKAKRPS